MTAFLRLESQFKAVNKLLTTLRSQPCLSTVAAKQADVLTGQLAGLHLDAMQVDRLVGITMETPWPGQLGKAMVEAVSSLADVVQNATVGRPNLQDFDALLGYLKAGQWHALLSHGDESAKLDILLDTAIGLGLRSPKESTNQLLATLFRIAVDGIESAKAASWAVKYDSIAHVRRTLKTKVRGLQPPSIWVETLWRSPDAFRAACPTMYQVHFGQEAPVPCPLPEQMIRSVQSTVPMRSTRKASGMAVSVHDAQPGAMMQQIQQMMLMMGSMIANGSCAPAFGNSSRSAGFDIKILQPPPRIAAPLCDIERQADATHESKTLGEDDTAKAKLLTKSAPRAAVANVTHTILEAINERDCENSGKAKKKKDMAKAKVSAKGKNVDVKRRCDIGKPNAKGKTVTACKSKSVVKKVATKLGCSKCRQSPKGCARCKAWAGIA